MLQNMLQGVCSRGANSVQIESFTYQSLVSMSIHSSSSQAVSVLELNSSGAIVLQLLDVSQ